MAPDTPRFLIDTMLGRLTHWLRAMGYDAVCPGRADDDDLLRRAGQEGRLLLTRDVRLATAAAGQGCLVRARRLEEQLTEVVAKLGLAAARERWLSRCLACNTPVEGAPRQAVRHRVPPRALALHDTFWVCPGCGRVFWQGSHADRIVERLAALLGPPAP
jgi:hypothetical protein